MVLHRPVELAAVTRQVEFWISKCVRITFSPPYSLPPQHDSRRINSEQLRTPLSRSWATLTRTTPGVLNLDRTYPQEQAPPHVCADEAFGAANEFGRGGV